MLYSFTSKLEPHPAHFHKQLLRTIKLPIPHIPTNHSDPNHIIHSLTVLKALLRSPNLAATGIILHEPAHHISAAENPQTSSKPMNDLVSPKCSHKP
ncbi:hypothetical protein NL676_011483 [Syzygium grande]|nr:hypothetical protein NL676_011483 [Syzygium grande]